MKTKNLFTLMLLAIGIVGCSDNIRVKSDYDRKTNFSQYSTYDWLPVKDIELKNNPLIYNELTDKRVKTAVNELLPGRGITLNNSNPDLRIHYHIIVEDRTVVRPDLYGSYSSPYWSRNPVSSYPFREGTLILDLMDAHTNALVWRGWSINILDGNDIELPEEKIKLAVARILENFPPARK
jgi:hypothetical protein